VSGVDGVTWQEHGTGLDEKLADLHRRIHRGTYRAQPSKRAYIPKADGRQRPLGIAALEDKIVQRAVVVVLNQIYEEELLGFSQGFRPGRLKQPSCARDEGRSLGAGRQGQAPNRGAAAAPFSAHRLGLDERVAHGRMELSRHGLA